VILSLIVPPQIIIGAHMALARESLYPVYNVCGRAWPVSPLVDQQIAGLVTWIPASMMSVVAALIVLRRWMRERAPVPVSAPVQGGML
jgi:putative membrane protein